MKGRRVFQEVWQGAVDNVEVGVELLHEALDKGHGDDGGGDVAAQVQPMALDREENLADEVAEHDRPAVGCPRHRRACVSRGASHGGT